MSRWTRMLVLLALLGVVGLNLGRADDKPKGKLPEPKVLGGILFRWIDTNKDDKISKAELTAYFDKKEKLVGVAAKLFPLVDTDKDGFLTKDEFKAAGAKLKAILKDKFPEFQKRVAARRDKERQGAKDKKTKEKNKKPAKDSKDSK